MRKPLVLLVVLVATSCTLEDVVLTAVDMAGEGTAVHPHLYFDEPMSEVSATSEPAATVCVRHVVNFDATVAEAKSCAEESIPLEPWGQRDPGSRRQWR